MNESTKKPIGASARVGAGIIAGVFDALIERARSMSR